MSFADSLKDPKFVPAYVVRSVCGTWSVNYFPKDNYRSVSHSGYSQVTDAELDLARDMGLEIFDFKEVSNESFNPLFRALDSYHAKINGTEDPHEWADKNP